MFSRTVLFLSLALILSYPAGACEPVAVSFEEQVAAAQYIFIGTVEKTADNAATFIIERDLKSSADGESFAIGMVLSTCGIRFEPGQQWLYMGNTTESGSMLLRNTDGSVIEKNVAWVQKKFGN